FVDKAKAAGLKVLGHCLIWHSQCAPWFHYDKNGQLVSAEVLKKRMREHIYTIVNHFKGRIDAWDVVNEAFEDDGSPRKSLFYQILG
ncbi:endo-1,4-beta-xylanase, partial [Klebsiella pneumoniae]|nr:endo-1,4-beta-xylanase [Klebsiella pneumoniae]